MEWPREAGWSKCGMDTGGFCVWAEAVGRNTKISQGRVLTWFFAQETTQVTVIRMQPNKAWLQNPENT